MESKEDEQKKQIAALVGMIGQKIIEALDEETTKKNRPILQVELY